MKQIALLIGLLILAATTGYAADDVIKIGMVNDQTGANKASGRGMKVGVDAWFKMINEKGGVNGKKLQLIVVDDQFVPEKTVDGLLKLVDEQKIFAVVGGVGTPNCVASLPIVKEYKLPMINPRTGASELREPLVKEVIHIRASYKQEVDKIVDHLVQKGDKRFAVFYQNDAFGKDILNATEAAVKRHGLSVVSKGSFERNTTAVTGGLAAIMEGKPDAIIVGAVYAPGAAFIKLARKEGVKAHVAGGSWAGGSNLAKAVGDAADGLVMSQVVPELEDLSLPLTKECKEAIDKNPEEIGFNTVSLEGCEVAKSIVMALDKAGNPPTKEGFLNAYESMKNVDLGGVKLSLSPTDHTAQDNVYLQSVQGGKLVPVKN